MQYTQEQLKEWYGLTSAEDIDPEKQQEKIDSYIKEALERNYHNHGGRR